MNLLLYSQMRLRCPSLPFPGWLISITQKCKSRLLCFNPLPGNKNQTLKK